MKIRALSLILAAAMIFSLAIPAVAEEGMGFATVETIAEPVIEATYAAEELASTTEDSVQETASVAAEPAQETTPVTEEPAQETTPVTEELHRKLRL